MKRYIIPFVMALAGGAGALALDKTFFSNETPVSVADTNTPVQYASLGGKPLPDFTPAAEQSIHAVVHVNTKFTTTQTYYDPFQEFFGGNGRQTVPQEQRASGSGVIISKDGYIVTNYHVIEQAEEIQVTLNDNRVFEATLVGSDPNTDLAVLKIEDEGTFPYIEWGNSDDVRIGEWVLAVGNPFNLTSTVTAGIVSAKARNINIIAGNGSGAGAVESFIQTDAAVNPGNSGGALVNTSGQLVGINTAIASQTGSFAGYSFAVPSLLVKKVVTDLMEFGMVQRGYLGVNIKDVNAELAKEKGLDKIAGVYVMGIVKNGAAEAADLEEGDVITGIDGVSVNSVAELQEQVNRHRPGEKVNVTYNRNGNVEKTVATLKNKNNTTELLAKEDAVKADVVEALGATLSPVDAVELSRLGVKSGVEISKLNAGKLRNSGVQEGFVITSVDRIPITTPDQLKELLETKKGGILIEGVYANGQRAYYALAL
jgi:Do/DeqQ family serine protease